MRFKTLGLTVIILLTSGCYTVRTSLPPPVNSAGTSVEVSDDGAGMNDYTIGTFKIPDSQVFVAKNHGISKAEGAFGVLGVLAADSSGKQASREAMAGTEEILGINVAEISTNVFRQKLSTSGAPDNWILSKVNSAGGTMKVTPYAFISPMASGKARVDVYLKSKYYNGSKGWSTKYIHLGKEIRPLTGDGSWSENDGARFRQAVTDGVASAIDAMFTDAQLNWPMKREQKVTARFIIGVDTEQTYPGVVLQESADTLVFTPKISDAAFYNGIHIIPKKTNIISR